MRFGPIALIRAKTLDQILEAQTFLNEQNNKLSVELGTGSTLHSFMHYPWNASTAPQVILPADQDGKRCQRAIERVIKAYQACRAHGRVPVGDSMWNHIEGKHREFLTCLSDGNQDGLREMLPSMFQSELIWGLGKFDANLLADMKRVEEKSHVQLRITDALMSFAEASGARAITNIEQDGTKKHLDVLSQDLSELLAQAESASGLDISSPEVGACYGCKIDGKFVTIDSIIHSYSVLRLKQLDAGEASSIAEIGGGFGCLGALSHRAGLKNYTIYDLPWVNALQGYFLLMSLPEEDVRLYGETQGSVQVLPFWCFDELSNRSVDYVFNCDSMPEMSYETCLGYIEKIKDVVNVAFLSINQEAQARNGEGSRQNSVPVIVEKVGGLRRKSRSIYWMRQGFLEEVYSPLQGNS